MCVYAYENVREIGHKMECNKKWYFLQQFKLCFCRLRLHLCAFIIQCVKTFVGNKRLLTITAALSIIYGSPLLLKSFHFVFVIYNC